MSEPTTSTSDERVQRSGPWTYAGLYGDGKALLYHWIADDGEDWYMEKPIVQGASIGGVYEVRYNEDAEGKQRVYTKQAPKYLRQSDDERLPAWRAQTKAIEVERETARRDKREAKDADELEAALAVLRRGYHAQRTMTQAAAFLAYCTASITRYEGRK